ncbi:uncharacterized protein LOC121729570 isoform X2 [Aricia agestis]|uniref:uncharacterized protein LOC121729570 isoform X2 n=1 Tax=Aricia agestis TaxID=91739 RepID=UPI001C205794|nr:uncharacterized protein LOC121729570 isoform X2 [Aricia agestis]
MTLDDVACKTNEFQQRRKLRLQQVREQSKDIAKKIRHRAKVEKLRHALNVDNKKEKEYFECQEKFVKRLQQIYSENLRNIGKAHAEILENKQAGIEKTDLSKLRGKEAAAELKRRKQEKLDEQKKILDRKLKAREVANELSREKSSTVIQKLSKESNKISEEQPNKDIQSVTEQAPDNVHDECDIATNDIGVQWESPKLASISQPEETAQTNVNTDKNKRTNLFALSDEMTLNMNEELAKSSDRPAVKPSLTMVSEYLQNRNLRLRETEPIKRKPAEDLQSIKQTILQTRAPKADGNKQRSFRSTSHDTSSKRSLVTVYDHTTKDSRCMPCGDGGFVHREEHTEDDAYSNAYKESTADNDQRQDLLNKQQKDMRGKIAMHRQNIDKEYRETLSFLNTLQKNVKATSMASAHFMTKDQQQRQMEFHQKNLEEEYRKVQKENCKHGCKHSRKRVVMSDRNVSSSPSNIENDKFQYSWMPVPESDGSLAIHTIPVKEKGNTVKFSQANSYHEYRSRHKHTPPTKDIGDKPKRLVETVVVEENELSDCNSSAASETSSVQDLNLENDDKDNRSLLDADRIIIYKILNSKKERKKKDSKTPEFKNRSLSHKNASTQNEELHSIVESIQEKSSVQEGLYKAVKNNGDHIEATCVVDRNQGNKENNNTSASCKCSSDKIKGNPDADQGRVLQSTLKKCDQCRNLLNQPTSSAFGTAKNDVKSTPGDGYIKLIDGVSQENSKFYIGASGFLKDSDYEVIIQLRKKEGENLEKKIVTEGQSVDSPIAEVSENNTTKAQSLLLEKDVATSNDSGIYQEQAEVADVETRNINSNKDVNSTNTTNDKEPVKSAPNKPNTCEKAVHTSFQNSFAVPENAPKTDPAVKATSTCTQTNFSSPTPRPPFMHMSTSTSTAYMSPPDVILPRLLGQNYYPTTDPYDSSNSISNGRESNVHRKYFKCKGNKQKQCNCAKCELKIRCPSKKGDTRKTTSATPPNTCRTLYRCDEQTLKTSKPHCHKHKNRNNTENKKCNKRKRPTSSTADSLKAANVISMFNSRYHTKLTKSQIDPVVKKYINKLLDLNQEGLKAIEIINQDCSDVTTPSNSVINVPSNVNKLNRVENKISLEQMKEVLKNEIISRNLESTKIHSDNKPQPETVKQVTKKVPLAGGRKRLHKVKSLNISKKVLKNNAVNKKSTSQRLDTNSVRSKTSTAAASKRTDGDDTVDDSQVLKPREQSSPVSKSGSNQLNRSQSSIRKVYDQIANVNKVIDNALHKHSYLTKNQMKSHFISSDSDTHDRVLSYVNSSKKPHRFPSNTNDGIGSDIDCMKIAEDKIQNIEKLADLTEKCTKRISNLAKVLEEVRRNKSLVYSQISSTDVSSGSSDNKSDTSVHKDQIFLPNSKDKEICDNIVKNSTNASGNDAFKNGTFGFVQLLKDLPKPDALKSTKITGSVHTDSLKDYYSSSNSDSANLKCRTKPPPALTRHLKHGQEVFIAPHELSTVVEVDSPMSVQMKSQSKPNLSTQPTTDVPVSDSYSELKVDKNQNIMQKNKTNRSKTESSEDPKLQMMNMKQFNEIMLKPFVSLQEYAKQCNIENLEDGSVIEEASKGKTVPEVISNSENSLPDVMTELLKRNVISEPFKFDSSSNNNSTSLSSESSTSLLALNKAQKNKIFLEAKLKLQKSLIDTSETMSTSSNPDLENALKKLGIGWASSTLKKTKERLALTSSSSTSSTSLRKFNMKSFNLELPTLGTDSISSMMSIKNDDQKSLTKGEQNLRNADQQTSPKNSMTVKEFLRNELAKKITFDNSKSRTAEEFLSLYETKIPEEMKNTRANVEEHSISTNSPNNRARTSTPVRNVFKSSTYQTSSSSNTSNGLFSNADDLSSVKGTSNSLRNHSTSDKEDLTIPNYSLKLKKGCNLSKSD